MPHYIVFFSSYGLSWEFGHSNRQIHKKEKVKRHGQRTAEPSRRVTMREHKHTKAGSRGRASKDCGQTPRNQHPVTQHTVCIPSTHCLFPPRTHSQRHTAGGENTRPRECCSRNTTHGEAAFCSTTKQASSARAAQHWVVQSRRSSDAFEVGQTPQS